MPRDQFLGNDLVHWDGADAREKQPHSPRAQRFRQRVLHPQELTLFHRLTTGATAGATAGVTAGFAAPLPWHKALWSLWAAKEAVFKAAVKAYPGLAFSPRSIRILMDPRTGAASEAQSGSRQSGWAEIGGQRYRICWESCSDWVHALAVGPIQLGGSVQLDEPGRQQTDPLFARIIRGVDRHEHVLGSRWQLLRGEAERSSAAVRRLALNLVRHIPGIGQNSAQEPLKSIEVRRPQLPGGGSAPPILHSINAQVNARLRSLDISLSHDGLWSAAALLV